jgi:SSS family solute:Na+ symporter
MLGLFLLGIISRGARGAEAATAVVIGVLVICWATLSPTGAWPESLRFLSSPFHSFMVTVIGTMTVLLVGMLLSRIRNGRPRRAASDVL